MFYVELPLKCEGITQVSKQLINQFFAVLFHLVQGISLCSLFTFLSWKEKERERERRGKLFYPIYSPNAHTSWVCARLSPGTRPNLGTQSLKLSPATPMECINKKLELGCGHTEKHLNYLSVFHPSFPVFETKTTYF